MRVDFEHGQDEIHLKPLEKKLCLFEGHLKREFSTSVMTAGCPKSSNFEVQILSSHLDTPMYSVENGTTKPLEPPKMENFQLALAPPLDNSTFEDKNGQDRRFGRIARGYW